LNFFYKFFFKHYLKRHTETERPTPNPQIIKGFFIFFKPNFSIVIGIAEETVFPTFKIFNGIFSSETFNFFLRD